MKITNDISWELIIVDDHSEDDTRSIAENCQKTCAQIKCYSNPGRGKVEALNYGYSKSSGEVIKFIDADDLLSSEFFECYHDLLKYDAHCHGAYVVDDRLRNLGIYNINNELIQKDYQYVLKNMVAIPRWSWSMKRSIAEKVFPMPKELPFEDVWFSLIIRLNANEILHIKKPLYYYRQHSSQTFGGILNYSKEALNFRSNRILNLITVLEKYPRELKFQSTTDVFNYIRGYYDLLRGDFQFMKIIRAKIRTTHKIRVLLLCFMPRLARWVTLLKWRFH